MQLHSIRLAYGGLATLVLLVSANSARAEPWKLDGRYENEFHGMNGTGTHSHYVVTRIHVYGSHATYQVTDNGDLLGGVQYLTVEYLGSRVLLRFRSCVKVLPEGFEEPCFPVRQKDDIVHVLERCRGDRARCLIGRGPFDDGDVYKRVERFIQP